MAVFPFTHPFPSNRYDPFGINNAGQIVGNTDDSTGSHGFLYSGGTFTNFDVPGANTAGIGTIARGINDAGQIVGLYEDNSVRFHGFIRNGDTYTTLDDPLAGPTGDTEAYGINHSGQIVGFSSARGFLYSNNTYTTIDDPSATGPGGTVATGINDAGPNRRLLLHRRECPGSHSGSPRLPLQS
jgi:probable HAF family extracellular repeat protein